MATKPNHLKAPDWLRGKLARAYYHHRIKELPPLDYGQRELLAKAGYEHESYISAGDELEAYADIHGSVFVPGSTGNLVPHPAITLQQKHGEALRKWESQLRISLAKTEPEPIEQDELDEYL